MNRKGLLPTIVFTLFTLLFVSKSANAQSPGGISSNLKLWAKATSIGLSDGQAVSSWANSAGGTNLTQATSAKQPVFKNNTINNINYNPVVLFNGTSNEMLATSGFSGVATYSQAHVFTVFKSTNNTQASDFMAEVQASSGTVDISVPLSGTTYWDAGSCCSTNTVTTAFSAGYVNTPMIWSFSKDAAGTANGNKQDIRMNGKVQGTKNTSSNFTGNNSNYYLGSTNGASYYNGQIAEVIYYLGAAINVAAQNKIESYLAVKYGVTLDQTSAQNYTISNGTVIWNAATNASYKNNIFGVGIDNTSGLNQSSSASVNTAVLNITNAVSLTNNSFLMVSDNGSANAVSVVAGIGSGVNYKTNTTWRATQTGTRSASNFTYNNTGMTGYFALIASTMVPYMLVDSNADGTYETVLTATSSSGTSYTFNTSLRDGALFSFGYKTQLDFGDAPSVPSTLASNGPSHVVTSGVYLGALIDAESDAAVSVNSMGDDTIGLADEDGVDFNIGVPTNGTNILIIGQANSVKVTASTAGYLNAWVDYNQNGSYNDPGEQVFTNQSLASGVNTVNFSILDSVSYGATSMRFRFAQNIGDVTAPTGLAPNGEVEDYKVYITAPLVGPCSNGFQNPGFEQGPAPATYIITSQGKLPYWRTTSADKMLEVWHTGFNGVPAYQGTYFVELEANMLGALYQDIYTTPGTTLLWHFAHRGRSGRDTCNLKIGPLGATVQNAYVIDNNSTWGVYQGGYVVPANQYITRFEFNALGSFGGNLSVGNFIDDVSISTSLDFADAPNSYGTLKTSNGPYHAMTGALYLGSTVTCDNDGQPTVGATGDSGDDGVVFPAVCGTCNTYTVNVTVFNNSGAQATVAGWIDFNKNGVFDATERVAVTVNSNASPQLVNLTFTLNASMYSPLANGNLYARFRVANSAAEVVNPTGLATSGEVEDYQITCGSLPIPIPTNNGPICARTALNLSATGTAPFYFWSGPSSYVSTSQNATKVQVALADSGWYRVYAIYANGCETDSATKLTVNDCFVSLAGTMFDDRNGDGIIGGLDAGTNFGTTFYAVVTDTFGAVLSTVPIGSWGTFSFAAIPAYMTGMNLTVSTTNPSIGSTLNGPTWPSARWSATKNTYGTNNLAGSGVIASQVLPVNTGIGNITAAKFGVNRLPVTAAETYTILKPLHNSKLALVAASGLGALTATDPEDGTISTNASFKITDLTAMNGNQLYYDVNANSVLEVAEQLTTNTVIASYTPAKLYVKFSGNGSINTTFSYAAIDSAGMIDNQPQPYTIKWTGGALPVKMLYFGAEKLDDSKAILKWATAQEIDNDHFEAERSINAEDWTKIGEVKGSGNTTEKRDYSFTDTKPMTGVNYYRLKQVDIDGHYDYSSIGQVTFDAGMPVGTLLVYPNPTTKDVGIHIEMSNTNDLISNVTIRNLIGQVVHNRDLAGWESYHLMGLDVDKGVYLIDVTTLIKRHLINKIVVE